MKTQSQEENERSESQKPLTNEAISHADLVLSFAYSREIARKYLFITVFVPTNEHIPNGTPTLVHCGRMLG